MARKGEPTDEKCILIRHINELHAQQAEENPVEMFVEKQKAVLDSTVGLTVAEKKAQEERDTNMKSAISRFARYLEVEIGKYFDKLQEINNYDEFASLLDNMVNNAVKKSDELISQYKNFQSYRELRDFLNGISSDQSTTRKEFCFNKIALGMATALEQSIDKQLFARIVGSMLVENFKKLPDSKDVEE